MCQICLLALSVGLCLVNAALRGGGEIWMIDNIRKIGGHDVETIGMPQAIQSPQGDALAFDGLDDALFLDTNPLSGARAFTVEVIFRPDPGGGREQRFLHMQASEDRRVLIETRLNAASEWFLDTFIKSGQLERTLQSRATLHPLGRWYHVALTYDGRQMRHFVNGIQEASGPVGFTPMEGGKTSIGCRLNRVFWFKGAIRLIRVAHAALEPEEFLPIRR